MFTGNTPLEEPSQLLITPEILRQISTIDEFKGRWQALRILAPDRLSALRRVATVESVGSSTRIEGSQLSDVEVEALLSRLDLRSFRSRDEEEVAGYAEAMSLIFDSYREIRLTLNHIRQLHGLLLQHTDKDQRHRGEWKTLPNHLEAFDADGRSLGIVFQTATPFDTPRLMDSLVEEVNLALGEGRHHPLLIIASFVVRFLAIHPFQDGNGRLSRVLTTLLLLRAGYEYVPYSSLERVVEENKDQYYRALRHAQTTPSGSESRFSEWVVFFLHSLIKQKEVLTRRLERESLGVELPLLSMKLLEIAREQGRVTLALASGHTGGNRNTLKVHLRHLVSSGRLVQHGKGRGTWYSLG